MRGYSLSQKQKCSARSVGWGCAPAKVGGGCCCRGSMSFPSSQVFPDLRMSDCSKIIVLHKCSARIWSLTKELSPYCCCETLFPKWTECWRISAFSFLQPFCFSLIVEPMENWLQLMLNWDPQQRGGGLDPETGCPKCFQLMDHILNLKVSEGCNWA